MDMARRAAAESHATRLKVGSIFVSPEGVMSMGINGLPAGGSNVCEHQTFNREGELVLETLPETSHSEENLFAKLMRQGVSTIGGTIYVTHAPCISCSKIIVVAGIKRVVYAEDYRNNDGLTWMQKNNIIVEKLDASVPV